jgi:hypothetical protein
VLLNGDIHFYEVLGWLRQKPASATQWLTFVEGNPGVPGDGVVVSGVEFSPVVAVFHLSAPIPLVDAPDGLTFTVFSPIGTPIWGEISFGVENNLPVTDSCHRTLGGGGGILIPSVTVNGVTGFTANLSAANFANWLDVLNRIVPFPGCPDVRLQDLFLTVLYLSPPKYPPRANQVIDAAFVGFGQNVVP